MTVDTNVPVVKLWLMAVDKISHKKVLNCVDMYNLAPEMAAAKMT